MYVSDRMRHVLAFVVTLLLTRYAWSQSPETVFRDCPDCPEMVVIPQGSFIMGSPESESGRGKDEGPQHNVTISRPFAAGKYEVTRGQFAAFARETGYASKGSICDWRTTTFTPGDNHPVVCVSWNDAKAYAAWLSGKTGKNYRLLSEAEWEYAARAGAASARPWGEDPKLACGFANIADRTFVRVALSRYKVRSDTDNIHQCDDGYSYTAPVGNYRPNDFGLYDMIGNAWEWVEDCYNGFYTGAPSDGSAWLTGDCGRRVARGGDWQNGPQGARSARRTQGHDWIPVPHPVGFRIARTL